MHHRSRILVKRFFFFQVKNWGLLMLFSPHLYQRRADFYFKFGRLGPKWMPWLTSEVLSVKHSKKQPTNTWLATADELYTHRRHTHSIPASSPAGVSRLEVELRRDRLQQPNRVNKMPLWHVFYKLKDYFDGIGNPFSHRVKWEDHYHPHHVLNTRREVSIA